MFRLISRARLKSRTRLYSTKGSGQWEAVIGLELHAQIASRSKIFSGAAVQFAAPPNTLVALLDAGLPGTLPVLNQRCVDAAVLTGLAINGTINLRSTFDRKHYFYCDLPLGYQITQQKVPIVEGGAISLQLQSSTRTVRIQRVHLEQDTGKSFHTDGGTLIDLNRAGTGLMEIVTHPDLRSADEAAAFVRKLQQILQEIGTCSGQMAEGSLRVDCNVSVRRSGDSAMGTRVEIKNVNGTRHLRKAIVYEMQRQIDLLERGQAVDMETRRFAWQQGVTKPLRSKETEKDYRYMPEPDLPPLILSAEFVQSLRDTLPELPDAKASRIREQYGVTPYESAVIVEQPGLSSLFEQVASPQNGSFVAKWIITEYLGQLNAREIELPDSPASATQLAGLLELLEREDISAKTAKSTLSLILDGDIRSPVEIVKERNWLQISDPTEIMTFCSEVIKDQKKMVDQYRAGKEAIFMAILGLVIKKSGGRANAKVTSSLLRKALDDKP